MGQTSTPQVVFGALLLIAGSALIIFVSSQGKAIIPAIIGSVAVLGVALGTLLIGISGSDGRPV